MLNNPKLPLINKQYDSNYNENFHVKSMANIYIYHYLYMFANLNKV
ncbi:protein of unknown function [Brochothrix thermosphacta]|nr:protein of unknown function [Brochothrix thermosphacta]